MIRAVVAIQTGAPPKRSRRISGRRAYELGGELDEFLRSIN
jgi:hypothetical protein